LVSGPELAPSTSPPFSTIAASALVPIRMYEVTIFIELVLFRWDAATIRAKKEQRDVV
jgi:hypothetical protein